MPNPTPLELQQFDPDNYLAQKGVGTIQGNNPNSLEVQQFDPDNYLATKNIIAQNNIQAKYGTPTEMFKAGLEQAASGATLGLSKVAETKLLGVKPEDIAGREAANPILSTLSNIGGTAAGLLGPEELLTPVKGLQLAGRGVESALGAGKLAKIAAPAVEGALFGGIQQATDDWSQDKALDAQKIAASAGIGALIGGGIGGVHAAVESLSPFQKISQTLTKHIPTAEIGDISGPITADDAFKAGRLLEGNKADTFVNKAAVQMADLHNTLLDSKDQMYKTGLNIINGGLDLIPEEQVNTLLADTMGKVDSLLEKEVPRPPGEPTFFGEEKIKPALSASANETVSSLWDEAKKIITGKGDNQEKYGAMMDFAKGLDKETNLLNKLNKMYESGRGLPLSTEQASDLGVLNSIREMVRGDLSDPEMWGHVGQTYGDISQRYAKNMQALNMFDKMFRKAEEGINGKVKVIAPAKIRSFMENAYNPASNVSLKQLIPETGASPIQDIMNIGQENLNYVKNFDAAKQSIEDLADRVQEGAKNIKSLQELSKAFQVTRLAKLDQRLPLRTLMLVNQILNHIPGGQYIAAPLYLVNRYAGVGGALKAGEDLPKLIQMTDQLSKHTQSVTDKINKGARSIFYGQ